MRRAARAASLVVIYSGAFLFLLSIALWVRSYRSADAIHLRRSTQVDGVWRTKHVGVLGTRGRVVLYRQTSQSLRATDVPVRRTRVAHLRAEPFSFLDRLPRRAAASSPAFGFVVAREFSSPGSAALVAPYWVVPLAFAPLAVCAIIDMRRRVTRRRRVRLGLCPACGYDLRASPGRCPECGVDASPAIS